MHLRDDERGQAIQVGAVLLFAILIVAFSTYQAVIIPADNRRVEFNHNQEVQSQLADLRNAVLGTAVADGTNSVSVDLGTQYPSRTLGLNPPPASGTLRTVGTTNPLHNVTIHNASADGETGDFWNGSSVTYNTGGLQYAPTYSRYNQAPTTVYEHSVLFNQFAKNRLILANQTVVTDDRLSIVAINGSLSRSSSGSTTVDVRPVSNGGESVLVEPQDPSSPITIEFASTLSVEEWRRILSDEDAVTGVTASTSSLGGDYSTISVTLASGQSYRLALTKAAVGTGATDPGPAYLTDVGGDGESVQRGGSQQLTLAVRDRYNNPVAGVTINASVGATADASLGSTQKTTGTDGRVTFTYQPGSSTPTGDQDVNFTTGNDAKLSGSTFDPETAENVTMTAAVTASGGAGGTTGAYTVDWTDPSGESSNSGDIFDGCDNETCTWDVGASSDGSLALNATVSPIFEGVDVEFAASNTTVGTVSPPSESTNANGAAVTTLFADANGTVDVLASANEGSDVISINVQNVTGGGGSGDTQPPTFDSASAEAQSDDGDNRDSEYVAFTAEVSDNGQVDRVELTVSNTDGNIVGQRTLTPPFYDQSVDLDPDAQMNGNSRYITVELTAYDTSGNYRTCSGQINDINGSVSLNNGLDCSTTSP